MDESEIPQWEAAGRNPGGVDTWRLKVPGGWVYEVRTENQSNAVCFVPEKVSS